jgi:hypothetical protein
MNIKAAYSIILLTLDTTSLQFDYSNKHENIENI